MIGKKTGKLTITQQSIAYNVSTKTTDNNWRDYNWQLNHSIRDIDTFEKLTEIKFSKKEIIEIKKTISKFPLSITPYYASLIEKDHYPNDPIFKQAFPDPDELKVLNCEM